MISNINEYQFTNDWFDSVAKSAWDVLFKEIKPKKILEIGSYEGASTCYLITNCGSAQDVEIHCIDTWEGGEEHKAGAVDMQNVETRFQHNTKLALQGVENNVTLITHKGYSSICLAELLSKTKGDYFDFIYVDGSHQAPDVLMDAVLSFNLLKVGGTMIFDDYLWKLGYNPLNSPKSAIDAFMNIYFEKINILGTSVNNNIMTYLPLYQLYTRKISK